jgi:predicted nucleic acid-binding protein
MNSLVCVDACLALKLVLGEDDSPQAIALWRHWVDENITVVAPPLLAYEVTSVLRTKVHRGLLTPEAGDEAFREIHAQGIHWPWPGFLAANSGLRMNVCSTLSKEHCPGSGS